MTQRYIDVDITFQSARSSGLTLITELFGRKYRTFAGIALEFQWVVLYLLLPLIAYFLVNWRYLQLVLSVSSILWVIYIW